MNNNIENIFSEFLISNFNPENSNWEKIAAKLFESRKDQTVKEVSYFYFKKDADLSLAGLNKNLIDNFIEEFLKNSENYLNEIEEYFLDLKNLYEPQKRLILEYITECVFIKKNYDLYKKLMSIILKINKKVFSISLEENKNDKNVQNLFKNLLILIQLSDINFNYNNENKNLFDNKNEEIVSPLFRSETIIIEFPLEFELKDYYELLGIFTKEKKKLINFYFRPSSHRILTFKDEATKKEISIENKIHAIFSGLDYRIFDRERNYGIEYDINFWRPELKLNDDKGNRGHFLLSFDFDFNKSRFLFKIEDCGYLKNSIFGHEHGYSTARNYISPSGHFKILNPFINRKSMYCDLRKFNKKGIFHVLKILNEINLDSDVLLGTNKNFIENAIKKNDLEHEIKNCLISRISGVKIYRKVDRNKKGNYFTEYNVVYYGFVIENEDEFKKWFEKKSNNKEIFERIFLLQNLWLYKCDSENKNNYSCKDFFNFWNINFLPEIFFNDFNDNINYLINVYGNDSIINIENYYENFGNVKENNKIYFIFDNKNENGKKIQNSFNNYFNINVYFNENFDKIIFKENSLNLKNYLLYLKHQKNNH